MFGSSSDNSKLLPHDFQPGPFDVICGRGKTCYKHPGNLHMRKVVEHHVDEYARALTKEDKSTIVTRVVHEIQALAGSGGFVKQYEQQQLADIDNNNNNNDLTQQQQFSGTTAAAVDRWYCVPFAHAREKISQAFRDLLHDRYKSSIDSRRAERQQQGNKRKESSTYSGQAGMGATADVQATATAATSRSSTTRYRRPAKKLHAISDVIVSPLLLSPSPFSSTSAQQPAAGPPEDVVDLTACLTRLSVVLTFDESFSKFMDQAEEEETDHVIASFFQQQPTPPPAVEAPMPLTPDHDDDCRSDQREAYLPRLSLVFSVDDMDYTLFMEQGMEWLDKPDEVFSMERLNAKLEEIDISSDRVDQEESASCSSVTTPFDVQRRRDSTDLLEAVTALQACFGHNQEKYEILRQSITRSSVKLLQTVLGTSTDMLQECDHDRDGCTSGEQ